MEESKDKFYRSMNKLWIALAVVGALAVAFFMIFPQTQGSRGRLLAPAEIHQLIVAGDYVHAIEAARKGIKTHPDQVGYYLLLGEAHEAADEFEEALRIYRQVMDRGPYLPQPHYFLGRAYYRKKDIPQAVRSLQTSVELTQKNLRGEMKKVNLLMGYTLLSKIYFGAERDYAKAADTLENILALDPVNWEARYQLGWSYVYLKRPSEARKQFGMILQKNPKTPIARQAETALQALGEEKILESLTAPESP